MEDNIIEIITVEPVLELILEPDITEELVTTVEPVTTEEPVTTVEPDITTVEPVLELILTTEKLILTTVTTEEPVTTVEPEELITTVEPVITVITEELVTTLEPVLEPVLTTVTTVTTLESVSTTVEPVTAFDFISNPTKMSLLSSINETLNINKFPHNKLIFVYSAPKVGSTSIVSSLRIFGTDKFSVIHIHDEEMLKVLGHVNGITVNEIILYNKYLGKDIYVIDVYRSPIERKISAYFEKIGAYHFNNTDENVNSYNVQKIINRFNKIIPYLAIGDHFIDKYNINIPDHFDYNNKYLLVEQNGIKYIKLRLKDTALWNNILSNIFGSRICIVKDYESTNKPIKDLFLAFKSVYRIPRNLLDSIMQCKYLKYFYSPAEQDNYFRQWTQLSTTEFNCYTEDQFKMYEELTMENSHIDYIQLHHYMDEGCNCKACNIKRHTTANKIMCGITLTNVNNVKHDEAKTQLMTKRVVRANKINAFIKALPPPQQKRGKDFKRDMANIVNGKTRI